MSELGLVSQTYMFILLALLFVGSGLAVWSFLNFVIDKTADKPRSIQRQVILNDGPAQERGSIKKMYGGKFMNNGWLKLAVFSFVGILVSVIVLGFVSTSGANAMNMTSSNTHLQHQQQGTSQSGYSQMQGNMDVNSQMGNMQMQGNMNGNMGTQMTGNMNGITGQQSGNEYMMMQQQLNQMQMQLNQIQQQQMGMAGGSMSGNTQLQSGGMSSMPQSSSGMGMGMMPMMNMGGSMSSMPQSNSSMSSMPQSSSSGSSGGMGMM